MAEGDTIVRAGRKLEAAFDGREVLEAITPNPRSTIRGKAGSLEGRQLEKIETRGKHLILHFSEGLSVHSHLGMNGSWQVAGGTAGSGFRRPERNAWLLLDLDGVRVAQFGGTTLRLVRTVELGRDPRLATLGPDILAPDFDPEASARRLVGMPGEIGVILLDQRFVCGIGNIFKSEACFEAGIDPWREAGTLELDEATRLLEIARRQMIAGVETGRRPGRIYRKAGRPCRRCRAATVRSRAQGDDARTTYWCPNCQS